MTEIPTILNTTATFNMPISLSALKGATRYVFCAGDFITRQDKRQLSSVHADIGGLRIGLSEHGGCPTMQRTNGIIYRGLFTPLEEFNDVASATLKNDETTRTGGYITRYPADDIQLVCDDYNREQGVIEITALKGKVWDSNEALELNRHFFPNIDKWLAKQEAPPVLLADLEAMVWNAPLITDAHFTTQQEILTAIANFRVYAETVIENNRQLIKSVNNNTVGGHVQKWSETSRLFAEQLGITLESDTSMIVKNQPQPLSNTADMELRERELALKERELELREKELEFARLQTTPQVSNTQTPTEAIYQGEQVVILNSQPNGWTEIQLPDGSVKKVRKAELQ